MAPLTATSIMPAFNPPKSPRRFFSFSQSANPPPLPTHTPSSSYSSISSNLGLGAIVVRTPQDALSTMKGSHPYTAGLAPSSSREESPPVPRSAPAIRYRPSQTSPPKGPCPPIPFSATLLSHSKKYSPTLASSVLITLEFAYSLDDPPRNVPVTLPLDLLRRLGQDIHLVAFIERQLDEGERLEPDLTDGESAADSDLESDYGLSALLRYVKRSPRDRDSVTDEILFPRDEYLLSLTLDTSPPPPKQKPLPPVMPISPGKRAQTRNQYTQLALKSTPPLRIRKSNPNPTPATRGWITEMRILLLRDAVPYHLLAERLISGHWGKVEGRKRRIEEELKWLGGQLTFGQELKKDRGRSMVFKGGEGYI
ncbi:hypothetical protein P7C73_g6733, partial [Tremellales sp. Uapishka_1]